MKRTTLRRFGAAVFGLLVPTLAQATLTIAPLTWNVVGLDSNSPASGPRFFPVGARVCSDVATSNVSVDYVFDSANANINLRPGSLAALSLPSIAAGACADAYFEIEVTRVAAAFDTTRRYHITATDGSGTVSTATPREIYVEHLISQNRNSVTGIKLNGSPIAAGGSIDLVVGNTYTIELDGGTATQGYNQFEAFINFPNTIFQILSVSTTYSADDSPYVPGPAPIASDKLYADACLWQNDVTSPNYRSCVGGDFKAGGNSVVTTYTIKVISGGGTSQTLNSLLYDFSGSSFHYNADFSVNGIIANIVEPASLGFSKAFNPSPTVAGGTSTLTFTLANPNSAAVSGVSFSDTLPMLSGSQMVVATPAVFSTAGCGSATFTPAAGANAISFANGSIAANASCTVSVQVSVPAAPTSGTYSNTSGHLFVNGADTGKFATANLDLAASAAGTGMCGLTLAGWTVPNGTTANPPDLAGGVPTIKAVDVATATLAAGVPGDAAIIASSGQNDTTSWETFGYKSGGQFVDFVVDTHKYTAVQMSFYVSDPSPSNGPTSATLSYSTGGAFTPILTFDPSVGSGFVQHTIDFTGVTSTTGSTTFRIVATGAKNDNSGASLNYDNIAFTGCGTPGQPTLTKAFSPSAIAVGGTSTLTFTLTNPNAAPLSGAKFSDALPSGLAVAALPAASTTCGGSPTWTPAGGDTTLAFGQASGATIAANGSCTVSVNVTATTAGPHTNVSGFVSTTEGGTNSGPGGSAIASLDAISPPVIAKAFGTNPILVNAASLLTFTITNPNASDALTGIAFNDTYPPGLVNANPLPAPANTCGGVVNASAGGNSVGLTGGTLAGGASCTVSVTVSSAAAGTYANVSDPVSATTAGTGNTASAGLTVDAPNPAIGLLKQVGTSATGPWFKFVTVTPSTPLYYRFTAENTGDVALNPFDVSDPTLAGTAVDPATCAWSSPNSPTTLPALPVASATIDPTATCVVGPISAMSGDRPNTATAHGTFGGAVYDSTASNAEYLGALPGFSLLKQVSTLASGPWASAIDVAVGNDVFYKFLLVNTGAFALSSINVSDAQVDTSTCTFTDPLPIDGATTCVVGPVAASGAPGSTTINTATGHGMNGGTPVDTAPSSASYTISSTNADLAITKDDGTTSVVAGGTTTYTITVTNNGPSEVSDATVADNAPAGMSFTSWTCSVADPGSGGTVTTACGAASGAGNLNTTVTMKNGAVVTYVVQAAISGGASGTLANTATVAPPSGIADPTPGNNSATDTDTVTAATPIADLAIAKDDGTATVNAGGTTTYTITVTNNGPSSVTGATLSDPAVAGLAKTSVACSATPGQCATPPSVGQLESGFTLPLLANGATYRIAVTANVTAATGSVSNTATVVAPAGTNDPNPANNSATDSDTVNPLVVSADIAVTNTDGVVSVAPGGNTTYTITITNNGPDDVTNGTLVDTAPAGVVFGAWTCSVTNPGSGGTVTTACGAANGTGNLNTTVTMKSGAVIVYTVPATIAPGASGSVSNTATVAVPPGVIDSVPANNSSTDTDGVVAIASAIADLSLGKSSDTARVAPGGTVTYTIVVTN
ncbi:MAG TPA: hypothetical protein VJ891_05670, partial [Casimicrobiaceae bacterium]|nr:hypothetical protein [Casimicrobiaceae bacterium]